MPRWAPRRPGPGPGRSGPSVAVGHRGAVAHGSHLRAKAGARPVQPRLHRAVGDAEELRPTSVSLNPSRSRSTSTARCSGVRARGWRGRRATVARSTAATVSSTNVAGSTGTAPACGGPDRLAHRDPAHPAIDRSRLAQGAQVAQHGDEGLLHGVVSTIEGDGPAHPAHVRHERAHERVHGRGITAPGRPDELLHTYQRSRRRRRFPSMSEIRRCTGAGTGRPFPEASHSPGTALTRRRRQKATARPAGARIPSLMARRDQAVVVLRDEVVDAPLEQGTQDGVEGVVRLAEVDAGCDRHPGPRARYAPRPRTTGACRWRRTSTTPAGVTSVSHSHEWPTPPDIRYRGTRNVQ